MEALILSCGTGGGHNSAGEAVKEELEKRGYHVDMMNPYDLRSTRLATTINNVYIKLVQKAPLLFGLVYQLGNGYRRLPFRSPVYFCNKKMIPLLQKLFEEHPYDVVFMPHVFPAEILTYMKQKGIQIPKTIFIATDYVCIPFTEETDCDAYIVPAEDLQTDFLRRGIPAEKLHPLGIPVHSSFAAAINRQEAILALGLDPEKHYLLVSGGSIGAGKIGQIIRLLYFHYRNDQSMQIIAICGNHDKLYQRLQKHYADRILVLKHTDQMAFYLKASDAYLTKPGGLSTTEAAVSGIPMLHTTPIPGCETLNMKYFTSHGMSLYLKAKKASLIWHLHVLLGNLEQEQTRLEMVENQRQINAHAAADIVDLAEQMTQQTV